MTFGLLYFVAYTCEAGMVEISCENYPGIISIHDVNFPRVNAHYCDNGEADPCVASWEEQNYLKCALRKWCDGKPSCIIPMLHGVYNYIQLPCRNPGIKIRIILFYDCIKCKFMTWLAVHGLCILVFFP